MPFKFLQTDKMNLILSAIAVAIAAISIFSQFNHRKPQITCEVLSSEQLAPLNTDELLEAKYIFEDKPVSYLWKIRTRLENTGRKTIVGEGQGSMLLHNHLSLDMPEGLSLIRVTKEHSDLPIVSSNLSNSVQLSFSQWREGESALLSFYLSSTNSFPGDVLPNSAGRELIDGEIVIQIQDKEAKAPLFTKIIPRSISRIASGISYFFLGTFVVMFLILPFVGISNLKDYRRWFNKHELSLIEFIDENDDLKLDREKYIAKPWKIPKELQKAFSKNGSKIPSAPMFETNSGVFFGSISFLIISLSMLLFILQKTIGA
jgi:hypothetical protein